MPNDPDPDPHICILQSDGLVSKYVLGAWLQFVDGNKRRYSRNILLLELSFPLEFFILHFTNREEDDRVERKLSEIKAGQSDTQID